MIYIVFECVYLILYIVDSICEEEGFKLVVLNNGIFLLLKFIVVDIYSVFYCLFVG